MIITLSTPTGAARNQIEMESAKKSLHRHMAGPAKDHHQRFLHSDVPDYAAAMHGNYLYALADAWAQHRPLTFSPHMLWYTILSEVAAYIKAHPEECRSLFTRSSDKIDLVMPTSDPTKLHLEVVMEHLDQHLPVDREVFFPEVSTHTIASRRACMAAFADAVTPYYSYSTFLCGIPAVKLLGTQEDYQRLRHSCSRLAETFVTVPTAADLLRYLGTAGDICAQVAQQFTKVDHGFWEAIYSQQRCGSGGEFDAFGWYAQMFLQQPLHEVRKLENFPSHVARVPYKNLDTGREFNLVYGCFYSEIDEDGFYDHQFAHAIFEKEALPPKRTDEVTINLTTRYIGGNRT